MNISKIHSFSPFSSEQATKFLIYTLTLSLICDIISTCIRILSDDPYYLFSINSVKGTKLYKDSHAYAR